MVDRLFCDATLAEWYDVLHPEERRGDFGFYLPLVMSAQAVLDVGCGTGALLHRAREAGHSGRLCGLDPAGAMLEQARRRSDIEWILGDLASVGWDQAFDLVVMAGHAFQVFVGDDELRASLASIRSALTQDGRFAFETRNPLVRAWQRWTPDFAVEVSDASGAVVRMEHEVQTPVEGDVIGFTTTFTNPDRREPGDHHHRSTRLSRIPSLRSDTAAMPALTEVVHSQVHAAGEVRGHRTETAPGQQRAAGLEHQPRLVGGADGPLL